jgi:hypothetical protein
VLETQDLPEEEASPARHASATFLAFVGAGSLPLMPCMVPAMALNRFTLSIVLTFLVMVGVGATRALIATSAGWTAGLETPGLGAVVAAPAYASGALVAAVLERA